MLSNELINTITTLAEKYDIEPAALLAVVDVESAGVPFWKVGKDNLPPIRFEGHYFYARLQGDQLATAIKQGLASKQAGGVENPSSYAGRYELLRRAEAINKAMADESTSWGLGQVMGANWQDLGYKSVQDLVNAANTVEGQIEMMIRFIDHNGLRNAINKQDWKKFAKVYNGASYKKNHYDTKLADAYLKYSGGAPETAIGDDIAQMQTMLNAVGNYNLKIDGINGTETRTALRDFQLKNGLKVDGVYGPMSREMLEKVYLELSNSKTTKIGTATAGIGAAGTAITEVAKSFQAFADGSLMFQILFIILTLVGLGFTIKAILDRK